MVYPLDTHSIKKDLEQFALTGGETMATSGAERLAARRDARFHVQVTVGRFPEEIRTPGLVLLRGVVVKVFRSDGGLSIGVGDEVSFTVPVCRDGDEVPPGSAHLLREILARTAYLEVYLNGRPPRCEVACDEFESIAAPGDTPAMSPISLGSPEEPRGVLPSQGKRRWWQLWR